MLLEEKKRDPTTGEQNCRLLIGYRKVKEQNEEDTLSLPNIMDTYDMTEKNYVLFLYRSKVRILSNTNKQELASYNILHSTWRTFKNKRLPMVTKLSSSALSKIMSLALAGLIHNHWLFKISYTINKILYFWPVTRKAQQKLNHCIWTTNGSASKILPGKMCFLMKRTIKLWKYHSKRRKNLG